MENIFTHFLSRGDKDGDLTRLTYATWFDEAIPLSEFSDDTRLFSEFVSFCVSLNVPITYKYLQVWCDTELRKLLHKTNIRVAGCETLSFEDPLSFETIYRTTEQVLKDNYNVLEKMESYLDDFKVEIASYFSQKKKERLTQTLASTFELLNSTDNVEEAAEFIADSVNAIQDIYSEEKIEELDNAKQLSDSTQMIKVTDCGLPAIDKDSVGLYTTQLFGVEAQSGTGKTRFVIGTYVYRALTVYHKDVVYISLEQKPQEIEAMLVAHHVFRMFNIQISDKMILTDTIPDEIRPQYEAAKYDLLQSGKYGKFVAVELDLYVETFITKIRALDKIKGPFDLICIDYMALIESKPAEFRKTLSEYEIIKTAFKYFKRYVRKTGKCGIAISQLNREGTAAGEADKVITQDMAQGGMNVYRHTDYNIAITATETMKLQQKRRFGQPKVRSSAGFARFICDTRLGFCYFKQTVKQAV